jgi:hypothetical protein
MRKITCIKCNSSARIIEIDDIEYVVCGKCYLFMKSEIFRRQSEGVKK